MLFRASIQKTRIFFHKTLHNLRSFLFGGYQRHPKPRLLNPISCGGRSKNRHRADPFYADFSEWDFNLVLGEKRRTNSAMPSEEPVRDEEACGRNFKENQSPMKNKRENGEACGKSFRKNQSPMKNKQENGEKEERKNMGSSYVFKREKQLRNAKGGSYALAQQMKELEMMDVGDVEHVLDVEEALHYYSRLQSPVYLDIVDKFFMDMYSEFSVPQASASVNNSRRRLGSIRL